MATGVHVRGGWPSALRRHVADVSRRLWRSRRLRFTLRWSLRVGLVVAVAATIGIWMYFNSVPLPDDPAVPQASDIYFSDGHTLLARVGVTDRTDVRLSDVPVDVRNAVLAAEDRDFYHHFGISVRGVLRAAWANVAEDGSEGASTITQQLARNAYLTQERTVGRKSKEAVLAVKLEHRYTKDEILERYLNAVYFGRGAYGIAAASRAYFGITPNQLSLAQGAVLAAVIKDPWNFDPSVDAAGARDRWRWIITSMGQLGWVDPHVVARLGYPRVLASAPHDTTPAGVNGLVVDLVERELSTDGISPQLLHTAGLRVVSTLDVQAQQAALAAVATGLAGLDPAVHAALVAVEPRTGAIRAYYGGNRGAGYFDDASAPRRPASTFKPVTLAAGLIAGVSYLSHWDGSAPRSFPDRNGVPLLNADGQQCPDCTLDRAMVLSLNTPFYALAERLGGGRVRRLAQSMGISPAYDGKPSLVDGEGDPWPGLTRADITLGTYPVTPADLASVYATFAAGGVRATRHVVETVSDAGGSELYAAHPYQIRVFDEKIADDVTAVLMDVVDTDGVVAFREAAGKTGTQQWGNTADNQDAWMAGYTPQLAVAVWLGRPDPGPIRDPGGHPIEGRGRPATIWRQFLTDALRGRPALLFHPPAHVGSTLVGDSKTNPALSLQPGAPPTGSHGGGGGSSPTPPPGDQPGGGPSPSGTPPASASPGPGGGPTASASPGPTG